MPKTMMESPSCVYYHIFTGIQQPGEIIQFHGLIMTWGGGHRLVHLPKDKHLVIIPAFLFDVS